MFPLETGEIKDYECHGGFGLLSVHGLKGNMTGIDTNRNRDDMEIHTARIC